MFLFCWHSTSSPRCPVSVVYHYHWSWHCCVLDWGGCLMCRGRLFCPGGVLVWPPGICLLGLCSLLCGALLFAWFCRASLSRRCFASNSRCVRVCVAFLIRIHAAVLLELTELAMSAEMPCLRCNTRYHDILARRAGLQSHAFVATHNTQIWTSTRRVLTAKRTRLPTSCSAVASRCRHPRR